MNSNKSTPKDFIREIRLIGGKRFFLFFLSLLITLSPLNSFDIYNSSLQEDEIIDLISYNKDNPLNLNSTSFDQLLKIPYIDFSIAKKIINRIDTKGNFTTLNQLKIEKIIPDEIYDLLSNCFFIVGSKDRAKKIEQTGPKSDDHSKIKIDYNSRFKRKLQKSRAYNESIYFGSDNYQSNKITFKTNNLKLSFLTKKDPGEISNTNNMKYSVSYSFNNNNNRYNNLILGYFKLKTPSNFIWDETSFRDNFIVSSNTINKNRNSRIKKYLSPGISSMDSYGLKGAAIGYDISFNNKSSSNISQLIEFYYAKKDITVNFSEVDDENPTQKIKTVITTGYNRTITEMDRYSNANYLNRGFVYQLNNRSKRFYLATSIYHQEYNYEFLDISDESRYNNSFVADLSSEYYFSKRNRLNINLAGNNSSNYSYNLIFSHYFFSNESNNSKKRKSLSSIHLKYQDQNTNKYNPFSVSNMLNSSYNKDDIERSLSLLFKGRTSNNKTYFELQNDFYIGIMDDFVGDEKLTGNKFKIQVETDLNENNQLKFTTTLKNEEQLSTGEREYTDVYEKKFELKHKVKFEYGKSENRKKNKNSLNLMSLLQYKDEIDGFGYLLSENITLILNPRKANFFNFLNNSKYKIRIGADSYYTEGKTLIYKNYFTTGLYTSLNSYSGKGISIYFITSYSFLTYYKITLGINENFKNYSNTFGSGYDEIEANKINTFEISFSYKYF